MLAALVAALAVTLPVSGPAWRGVVTDWLRHGTFAQAHTCAAVLVARAHILLISDPAGYSRLPEDLRQEAQRVCGRGDATRVRLGMSDTEVGAVAGLPRLHLSGSTCWTYVTRRICFSHGHVARIQHVTHG